jgi:hypothetical protein
MSTIIREIHSAMIAAMGVEGLKIPMTAVKFFPTGGWPDCYGSLSPTFG